MARKQHLINVHTSTSTTAPTGASLYLGEIAVQHTPNEPALWIKVGSAQTSEDYEKFIGETEIVELINDSKILGSGYTYSGIPYVNSATSIADAYSALTNEVLIDEKVCANALTLLNGRVDEISGVTSIAFSDINDRIDTLEEAIEENSGVTVLSGVVESAISAMTELSASVITNESNILALSASVVANSGVTSLSASVVDNKEAISAVSIDLITLSGMLEDDEYAIAQTFNSVNDRIAALEGDSALTALSASVVDNKSGIVELSGAVMGISVSYMEEITWSALKTKRDGGTLTPGMRYRITDYNTTTTQADTQAAGHQFDVIVLATDVNKLSEEARAIKHTGDTYFSAATLEGWKIWYCLDNDTTRFYWADSGATGRGVIYRMIDEWNNDCPYDFKNIQFKRKISLSNGYPQLDLTGGTDTWVFTFAATSYHITNDTWSGLKDGSLEPPYGHESDENTGAYHDNVMGKYIKIYDAADEDYTKCGMQCLNDNVFLGYWEEVGSDDPENVPYYYAHCPYGCTFGVNCYSNTFGTDCYYNTFGNGCDSNTFEDSCYYNTFGNGSSYNTFGNGSSYNTFGNSCYYNTFGNSCGSNTFGNDCFYNTFGNNCDSNTFGNNCDRNTFGNYCYYNTFGNNCNSIRVQKDYVFYIIVENGNRYIDITSTQTTSDSNKLRNFIISQGVNNTDTRKTISHNSVNDTFKTTYQPANSQVINI